MAYIGNDLQVAYQSYQIIDDISGSFNGSTTSFALLVGGVAPVPFPINEQQCLISVGGVIQEPDPTGTNGFKFSGGSIVFSSAPGTGEDFFGVVLAGADYVNVGVKYPSGSESAPSITFDTDLDTGIYNPAANELGFVTNGIGRLFISNDGKVGIGVPNPSSYNINADDLVIADPNGYNSGISINITNNTGYSNIWFGDYDGEGRGRISYAHGANDRIDVWVGGNQNLTLYGTGGLAYIGGGSTASPAVSLNGSAPSDSLVIDSSGRFLIGTPTADTSGNAFLQVNGSIKGTITSGTAIALTSGTAIDFIGIPSWVKRITVMFAGVSTNGSSPYLIQVGTSSIPVTMGYITGDWSVTTAVASSVANITNGFRFINVGAGSVQQGQLILSRLNAATWTGTGSLYNNGDTRIAYTTGRVSSLSTDLDMIRITTVNGTDTFDAGAINILYEG